MNLPEPWDLICTIGTSTVAIWICLCILDREHRRRHDENIKLPTKSLAIWSYLVIAIAPIYPILRPMQYIDDICRPASITVQAAATFQFLFMQYFQLSRLHYCFSEQQVRSRNGYPRWVFVLIGSGSSISIVLYIASTVMRTFRTDCGTVGTSFIEGARHLMFEFDIMLSLCSIISLCGFEVFTAFLYWHKIQSIMRCDQCKNSPQSPVTIAVRRNIQSILHRVLIMTLFYMIGTSIIYMVSFTFSAFVPVIYSLSMFLMQDHNTKEYVYFLRTVIRWKLYLCCCCYGRIIQEQYQALSAENQLKSYQNNEAVKQEKSVESNATNDDMSGFHKTGMELSIATKTVAHRDSTVIK